MRITNIKSMLCQPAVIVSITLTILWLFSDLSTRFIKSERVHKVVQTDHTFNEFVSRKLEKSQYERIVSLFESYIIKSDDVVDKVVPLGLTAEEQAKQEGTLSEVFIDDNKLVLKGIIQERGTNKRTALIQVTNIKTAETKLERFYSDKIVFGYAMKIMNSTQIQLSLDSEQQKQIITLTMFKVIKNETNS